MSDSDSAARLKTTERNDPCPCGSGKKYKKCHLVADQAARTAALQALEEEAIAKAKTSKDTEGEAHKKDADESTRSRKRREKQARPKGSTSGGGRKNLPRRGAV